MLITILLFYVVIMCCNEQVALEMSHNQVDGNFIMKTCTSEASFSWEGGYVRMISCGEIVMQCGCGGKKHWFYYLFLGQFSSGSKISWQPKIFCMCIFLSGEGLGD